MADLIAEDIIATGKHEYVNFHDHPSELTEITCEGCHHKVTSRFTYYKIHTIHVFNVVESYVMKYCISCISKISFEHQQAMFERIVIP